MRGGKERRRSREARTITTFFLCVCTFEFAFLVGCKSLKRRDFPPEPKIYLHKNREKKKQVRTRLLTRMRE